jgi:putative addiction module CopG family antidote
MDDMVTRASVNVSLTPELHRFVLRLAGTGRYRSVSEVFREGLRLLEQAERQRLLETWLVGELTTEQHAALPSGSLAEVRRRVDGKIREGLEALARGEAVDGETWFARLGAAGPRRRASRRPPRGA